MRFLVVQMVQNNQRRFLTTPSPSHEIGLKRTSDFNFMHALMLRQGTFKRENEVKFVFYK